MFSALCLSLVVVDHDGRRILFVKEIKQPAFEEVADHVSVTLLLLVPLL